MWLVDMKKTSDEAKTDAEASGVGGIPFPFTRVLTRPIIWLFENAMFLFWNREDCIHDINPQLGSRISGILMWYRYGYETRNTV